MRTHCCRCGNPLEPHKVGKFSWCTPCTKIYDKSRQKGTPIGHKFKEEQILRGSNKPTSKLTEGEVLKIRDIYSRKEIGCEKISKMFSVSKKLIQNVVHRKTWTHI